MQEIALREVVKTATPSKARTSGQPQLTLHRRRSPQGIGWVPKLCMAGQEAADGCIPPRIIPIPKQGIDPLYALAMAACVICEPEPGNEKESWPSPPRIIMSKRADGETFEPHYAKFSFEFPSLQDQVESAQQFWRIMELEEENHQLQLRLMEKQRQLALSSGWRTLQPKGSGA